MISIAGRIARSTAAVAALALAASPALADWAPTRWGMSVAQVLASVPEATEVTRQPDGGEDVWDHHRRVVAPTREMGFEVQAQFYFTPERKRSALAFVRLLPTDASQCDNFRQALLARFGAGTDVSMSEELTGMTWTDSANGDRLRFTMYAPEGESFHTCFMIRQRPA